MTNTDEVIEQFYPDLSSLLYTIPSINKVIPVGDFNACIGQDNMYFK